MSKVLPLIVLAVALFFGFGGKVPDFNFGNSQTEMTPVAVGDSGDIASRKFFGRLGTAYDASAATWITEFKAGRYKTRLDAVKSWAALAGESLKTANVGMDAMATELFSNKHTDAELAEWFAEFGSASLEVSR